MSSATHTHRHTFWFYLEGETGHQSNAFLWWVAPPPCAPPLDMAAFSEVPETEPSLGSMYKAAPRPCLDVRLPTVRGEGGESGPLDRGLACGPGQGKASIKRQEGIFPQDSWQAKLEGGQTHTRTRASPGGAHTPLAASSKGHLDVGLTGDSQGGGPLELHYLFQGLHSMTAPLHCCPFF